MAKKRSLDSAFIDPQHSLAKKEKKALDSIPPSPSNRAKSPCPTPGSVYNGNPETLPKLPEILDKSLEVATFTHQGTLNANEAHNVNLSYDRLEFLGDAYLEIIATRLIYSRFPKLSAGQMSQKRELLVKNETLADFSLAYSFDKRARLPKAVYSTNNHESKKLWTKVMGDLLEAYVAAVILSDPNNGLTTVEAWMTELWGPTLSIKDEGTLNQNAKSQLAAKIMGKGIKINYREDAPPEPKKSEGKILFRIGAYLTGWGWENKHLGSGIGWSKNEAGSHAAAQALSNPFISQVIAVKREFDAKVAAERKKNDAGGENVAKSV